MIYVKLGQNVGYSNFISILKKGGGYPKFSVFKYFQLVFDTKFGWWYENDVFFQMSSWSAVGWYPELVPPPDFTSSNSNLTTKVDKICPIVFFPFLSSDNEISG